METYFEHFLRINNITLPPEPPTDMEQPEIWAELLEIYVKYSKYLEVILERR